MRDSSTCAGDEWSDYIRRLERADAKTKKQYLPQAYRGYAFHLYETKPNEAIRYMERAITLDAGNKQYRTDFANMLYIIASSMVEDRQDNDHQNREARKLAEKALVYNKSLAKAHVLIGDIAYDNQDLHSAKLSWTRAQSFLPNNGSLKERLAKINTERTVEKSFQRESYSFFDVRYQSGLSPSAAKNLRKYLEEVRNEVGRDFRYFPRHKLVVLAYSQKGFDQVASGRGPGWWAAFYDGKIRVPLSDSGLDDLKPTLVHEYTHAVVHDLANGRCPRWMNEGMAEYQEAKVRMPRLHLLRIAAQKDKLIPLEDLSDALVTSNHVKGALAYEQSYSLIAYISQKHGFSSLTRIIEHLAHRKTEDEAFQAELGVNLFQLEQDWKAWVPNLVR